MIFVVHALDKPGVLEQRLAALAAHRAYLHSAPAEHDISVMLSGPMIEDNGGAMKGSFFLLDAPDRAAVEVLVAADPMHAADVWGSLSITALDLRQNNMSGA